MLILPGCRGGYATLDALCFASASGGRRAGVQSTLVVEALYIGKQVIPSLVPGSGNGNFQIR